MSLSGILSSAAFGIGAQLLQTRMQNVRKEFQQLGQDLQSGNLSAAQSDFATLQQLRQPAGSTTPTNSSPLAQDFSQLAADLKAGNTTASQQDYAKIQQDFQSQSAQTHHHHHHHSSSESGDVGQVFSQLGQALQSGNLAVAQQAYTAMQQQIQQYAQLSALSTQSSSSGISVSA